MGHRREFGGGERPWVGCGMWEVEMVVVGIELEMAVVGWGTRSPPEKPPPVSEAVVKMRELWRKVINKFLIYYFVLYLILLINNFIKIINKDNYDMTLIM